MAPTTNHRKGRGESGPNLRKITNTGTRLKELALMGLKIPRDEFDQGLPTASEIEGCPDMQSLVIEDIQKRLQVGIGRYGQGLKAKCNRDLLLDAYEEALDLCVYLRGVLYERDNP